MKVYQMLCNSSKRFILSFFFVVVAGATAAEAPVSSFVAERLLDGVCTWRDDYTQIHQHNYFLSVDGADTTGCLSLLLNWSLLLLQNQLLARSLLPWLGKTKLHERFCLSQQHRPELAPVVWAMAPSQDPSLWTHRW